MAGTAVANRLGKLDFSSTIGAWFVSKFSVFLPSDMDKNYWDRNRIYIIITTLVVSHVGGKFFQFFFFFLQRGQHSSTFSMSYFSSVLASVHEQNAKRETCIRTCEEDRLIICPLSLSPSPSVLFTWWIYDDVTSIIIKRDRPRLHQTVQEDILSTQSCHTALLFHLFICLSFRPFQSFCTRACITDPSPL